MTNKRLISRTLARHMLSCVTEYELIKSKRSVRFKTVNSFCEYHKFSHQNFMKIYHRYKQNPDEMSLISQKRGPRFKTRRFDLETENETVHFRKLGNNRYEIRDILASKHQEVGLNRLGRVEKQ
jgi:hypothetical protein